MKISIIGASGKVGLEVIRLLSEQDDFVNPVTVILYSPNNTTKVFGYLQDLEESFIARDKSFAKNICFVLTSDIQLVQCSDLIIITAGLFATEEEKNAMLLKDISGRDIQSTKNLPLICDICNNLREISPLSQIIIITNQVDIMSAIAREILMTERIYGLGCYIDTIRFKNIFVQEANKNNIMLDINDIQANILGYHNNYLFLDSNNFRINCDIEKIFKLVDISIAKTILRGKEISDLQKDVHNPQLNSGSSKLPAAALFNIIGSYTQPNRQLSVPLNRLLNIEEQNRLGKLAHPAAQLLCKITHNNIEPLTTYLASSDIEKIKNGAKNIEDKLKTLTNSLYKPKRKE